MWLRQRWIVLVWRAPSWEVAVCLVSLRLLLPAACTVIAVLLPVSVMLASAGDRCSCRLVSSRVLSNVRWARSEWQMFDVSTAAVQTGVVKPVRYEYVAMASLVSNRLFERLNER